MKKYIIALLDSLQLSYKIYISEDIKHEDNMIWIDRYENDFHIQIDSRSDSYANIVVEPKPGIYEFGKERNRSKQILFDIIEQIRKYPKTTKSDHEIMALVEAKMDQYVALIDRIDVDNQRIDRKCLDELVLRPISRLIIIAK